MTKSEPEPATGADGHPSLRERNRARTRRAILEAIAEIELVHGGMIDPSLITYTRIAEIAGVSERTVYRFFPTRGDLDEAYTSEVPTMLDVPIPEDLTISTYPDLVEEIGRRWAERTGNMRVAEYEIDGEQYPLSMAARRARDQALVGEVLALVPNADTLSDRQLLTIAAALNSTISLRSIAITAQRWNLTIEEATKSHAWALRTLLESISSKTPEPWEDLQ